MKEVWSLAGCSLIHHDDLQPITGLVLGELEYRANRVHIIEPEAVVRSVSDATLGSSRSSTVNARWSAPINTGYRVIDFLRDHYKQSLRMGARLTSDHGLDLRKVPSQEPAQNILI
jgi:hypothetical protein